MKREFSDVISLSTVDVITMDLRKIAVIGSFAAGAALAFAPFTISAGERAYRQRSPSTPLLKT